MGENEHMAYKIQYRYFHDYYLGCTYSGVEREPVVTTDIHALVCVCRLARVAGCLFGCVSACCGCEVGEDRAPDTNVPALSHHQSHKPNISLALSLKRLCLYPHPLPPLHRPIVVVLLYQPPLIAPSAALPHNFIIFAL